MPHAVTLQVTCTHSTWKVVVKRHSINQVEAVHMHHTRYNTMPKRGIMLYWLHRCCASNDAVRTARCKRNPPPPCVGKEPPCPTSSDPCHWFIRFPVQIDHVSTRVHTHCHMHGTPILADESRIARLQIAEAAMMAFHKRRVVAERLDSSLRT